MGPGISDDVVLHSANREKALLLTAVLMVYLDSFYSQWSSRLLSVLRIVTAFLFMPHGAQKLFGFLTPEHAVLPPLLSLLGLAGVLEFFGGLFILLGLFTRPVAFILSGEMAVAYFMVHAPKGFWPLRNGGDLAAIFCFVFLYLALAGGGSWSMDRLWRRDKSSHHSSAGL
jgi:putative oxidoreductase